MNTPRCDKCGNELESFMLEKKVRIVLCWQVSFTRYRASSIPPEYIGFQLCDDCSAKVQNFIVETTVDGHYANKHN